MLGKKESKSDGELRRKHWFCIRGNISAGPHARLLPARLSGKGVVFQPYFGVQHIQSEIKRVLRAFMVFSGCSVICMTLLKLNITIKQCRLDWTCTQTKDSTCKLQMQRKHGKISSKFLQSFCVVLTSGLDSLPMPPSVSPLTLILYVVKTFKFSRENRGTGLSTRPTTTEYVIVPFL